MSYVCLQRRCVACAILVCAGSIRHSNGILLSANTSAIVHALVRSMLAVATRMHIAHKTRLERSGSKRQSRKWINVCALGTRKMVLGMLSLGVFFSRMFNIIRQIYELPLECVRAVEVSLVVVYYAIEGPDRKFLGNLINSARIAIKKLRGRNKPRYSSSSWSQHNARRHIHFGYILSYMARHAA